ncbi:MAG TPA: ABC transporter permease [Gemmatimonadaceae bacterium]
MPMSLRHALRSLKRTPVFTGAAILTLVLGIGSLAATFAIVYGVLLAPLAYGNPDRLISVGPDPQSAGLRRIQQPPAVYFTYKRFARRIAEIGFYRTGSANIWTSDGGNEPERVTATWVTSSTIPLLQVTPTLGRSFRDDEDRPNSEMVAIISESVWRSRFQGARDVIGKKLIVNSVPREIIGVMPDRFSFPAADTRLWLPTRLDPSSGIVGGRAARVDPAEALRAE